jgi:hypothetical protein
MEDFVAWRHNKLSFQLDQHTMESGNISSKTKRETCKLQVGQGLMMSGIYFGKLRLQLKLKYLHGKVCMVSLHVMGF